MCLVWYLSSGESIKCASTLCRNGQLTTVSQKGGNHTSARNFAKYSPIAKILSPRDFYICNNLKLTVKDPSTPKPRVAILPREKHLAHL